MGAFHSQIRLPVEHSHEVILAHQPNSSYFASMIPIHEGSSYSL